MKAPVPLVDFAFVTHFEAKKNKEAVWSLFILSQKKERKKRKKKKEKPLDFSYNCKAMLPLQTYRAAAVKSVISNENKNKKESRRKEPLQI